MIINKTYLTCSCGGNPCIRTKYVWSGAGWGKSCYIYWVECEKCQKRSKGFNEIDYINPKEQAINNWNSINKENLNEL